MFEIGIDENMADALNRALAFGLDMTPAMKEIAAAFQFNAQMRFEEEVDPSGHPWQRSIRARETGGKTLHLSGDLLSSIGSIDSIRYGPDFAESGVTANFGAAVYAAIHQFGGAAGRNHAVHLPARPFIGLSAEDRDAVEEILGRHLLSIFE